MEIRLGTTEDIDELAKLYDDLNDYLEATVNYPGWAKGIYPIRVDAEKGVEKKKLYVAIDNGRIISSFILWQEPPEEAYNHIHWLKEITYNEIYAVCTFVVHPDYINKGIGRQMMQFAYDHAKENHIQSLRLDVWEKNAPAIHLYESMGYQHIDKVSLGYEKYGLDWYDIYEQLVL